LAGQLRGIDVADRTGVWRTVKDDAAHPSARHEIGTQRSFEFAQAPHMVGALIYNLARRVDVLDFGDREHKRVALRMALPEGPGADNDGGGQGEAQRS
jgi:hypothetical protein